MNIYDFDNTILKGDSSFKFIIYSMYHHPIKLMYGIFKAILAIFKSIFKKTKKGYIKSELYSFVKYITNLDEYVLKFVLKNQKNIKEFYLKQKKNDDIILSASYDFIIKPFCTSLGIKNVIATKYDVKKGTLIGNHCKGEEKVKRLKEEFPKLEFNNAYSDSLVDYPMFKIAKKAYLVKNEKIIPYK